MLLVGVLAEPLLTTTDSARCLSPTGQCSHPVLAVEPLHVRLVVELNLVLVHHYH